MPLDVSIVGFDDIPEAAHFYPPLTTVHQDFYGAGEQAVAMLVARLTEPATVAPPPLRPWLVERSSTTRPERAAMIGSMVMTSPSVRRSLLARS